MVTMVPSGSSMSKEWAKARSPRVYYSFGKRNCSFEDQMNWKMRFLGLGILIGSIALAWAGQAPAVPQAQQTPRPTPPTRDPHSPGYVQAKELPDGTVPPPDQDGNFIIGPTHAPAPEMTAQELTHGSVVEFTMSSADSKY
jgi:enterochelin esterase family protein